jgi:mono/diheme cytochrome c family protein
LRWIKAGGLHVPYQIPQRGGISMTRIVALGAFLITVTAGLVQAQDASEQLKGARFAQEICAECHAVQAGQPRSPNGQAPTFETVAKTPGMTAIALTAVLRTSHRTMPNIIIADDDLRNVIAYILTLK